MGNNNQKEREKVQIKIDQHPDFQATSDSSLKTSMDLSKIINALFRGTFADYTGCRVFVDTNVNTNADYILNNLHPVQVELYFIAGAKAQDGKLLAFQPIVDKIADEYKPGKGVMNYTQATLGYNAVMQTNKSCELTQGAIDIFQNMLYREVAMQLGGNPTAEAFAKVGAVVEKPTTTGATPYMSTSTHVVVYNMIRLVDINSILDLIYSKPEESKKIYNVVPIKPTAMISGQVAPMMNVGVEPDQRWLFNVTRIDQANFLDKCNELGNFNIGAGLNICTE